MKWTGEKVKVECRLTGSWFGFQVPRRRGGVEAGPGRRRRPGKGDKKSLFIARGYFSVAWPVRNIKMYHTEVQE